MYDPRKLEKIRLTADAFENTLFRLGLSTRHRYDTYKHIYKYWRMTLGV